MLTWSAALAAVLEEQGKNSESCHWRVKYQKVCECAELEWIQSEM